MLSGFFTVSSITALSSNKVLIKSSGTIATTLPLHVEGRYTKNSLGQTVLLRGVNQEGMLDDPNGWWNPEGGNIYSGYGRWNPDAVEYNLDCMKEWNVNVLRLLLTVEWWKNDESNYRQHVKDTIGWAGERGIYVLVVFWNIQGNGAPDALPIPNYSLDGSEDIVSSNAEFKEICLSVVQELGDYPNFMFEFWNEPRGDSNAREEWLTLVQDTITEIRQYSDCLIIVQWGYGIGVNLSTGNTGGEDLTWIEEHPLTDSTGNLVYSIHAYRGDFRITMPEWIDCYEYDDLVEGYTATSVYHVIEDLNKCVIVGEIGANMWWTGEELEHELTFYENSLQIYNELEIGYIAWIWTVPAHMQHGLLQSENWCPPPTQSGEILISKIAEGQ